MRATFRHLMFQARDITGEAEKLRNNAQGVGAAGMASHHGHPARSSAVIDIRKRLNAFSRSSDGAMAVMMALSLVVILGVVALGVEVASWYQAKRQLQTAADAAAAAVALTQAKGLTTNSALESAANTVVSGNGLTGYACKVGGATGANSCVINNPPSKGTYSTDTDAFEVVLNKTQGTLFATMFRSSVDIASTGVAKITTSTGPGNGEGYCFLALDTGSTEKAAHLENHTILPPQCGIVVNSSSNNGLFIQNNTDVQGPTTTVAAAYHHENSAQINEAKWYYSQPATPDPYASVTISSSYRTGSCSSNYTANKNKTFTAEPGFYCDFVVSNQATVNLSPGVYYIEKKLSIANNTNVNGTGVTFVMVKSGVLDLANNSTITMNAPTEGDFAGVAFMADRNSPYLEQKIQNALNLNVNGAFYFPSQKFLVENSPNVAAGSCTQLIAWHLHFQNRMDFERNCAGTGVKEISGYVSATTTSTVSIVE